MEQEIALNLENLETMMTVVDIKDNAETMMVVVQVGIKIKTTTTEEMDGVKPLTIRLIKVTNGVLKEDLNLKLKADGETRKSRSKQRQLADGVIKRKNPEAVVETIGETTNLHPRTQIMEEAAGAEYPYVYKIEIKFTVSF